MKANARSRDGEAKKAPLPNRIAGIRVRGFKSIYTEQRLDIRPLTLLAGANSSGKSSMLQPLLLLKQTLEAPSDPGALLLDGPNVRFTRSEQLLSRSACRPTSGEFYIGIDLLNGQLLETLFQQQLGAGFTVCQMSYSFGDHQIVLTQEMSDERVAKAVPKAFSELQKDIAKSAGAEFRWTVERTRCFLAFVLAQSDDRTRRIPLGPFGSPSVEFLPHIQGMLHLPPLRGNPQRTYPRTAGGPAFPGTFEPYAASLIAQWQADGDPRFVALCRDLEAIGLTWKVAARRVDDTQVELMVGRLFHSKRGGAHDLVNIADVGFGLSQTLPVVVALIAARPGQLVYIEQPEIHLHPLAQRRLANVLLHAVEGGAVVVIETHSILLLRAVQTLVATGRLPANDVALHWFQRDETGQTQVHHARLDDTGAYGDWPEDFDRTELEAEQAYLDAVESRRGTR